MSRKKCDATRQKPYTRLEIQMIMNGTRCAAEVLVVDDNQHDVVLTREAFKQSELNVNLHHVENGAMCMAFLHKKAEYGNAPTPDLILLDLNMPVMNGREVLAELAKDDGLSHIPVVVLTTSCDEREVLEMYKLKCSSYNRKLLDFGQFADTIANIANYYLNVIVLPPRQT